MDLQLNSQKSSPQNPNRVQMDVMSSSEKKL